MRTPAPLAILLLALTVSACAGMRAPWNTEAQASLNPVGGGSAAGLVTFSPAGKDLLIQGTFSGLTPGSHGLHIHEGGDCGGPGARAAGGHLNPTGARHGQPGTGRGHLGDLPMLTAGADGTARFQARMPGLTLDSAPTGVLDRTVIVTARPDDFTSQPSGNSGPAVACGVISRR